MAQTMQVANPMAEEASKANKAKLNSIGDEYWWHVHNQDKQFKIC